MLQALRGRVIVLPNEREETVTESGIVLGKKYNPELGLRRGKVISAGAGVREVKEGDEACYMAYSGQPLRVDNTLYLVMMEDDIVGIGVEG
jgi:co-chaperonin GroES (HSP10)